MSSAYVHGSDTEWALLEPYACTYACKAGFNALLCIKTKHR